MSEGDKVRENRLRRMASRQGLTLQRSRLRDSRAIGYGTYQLVDARTGDVKAAAEPDGGYGLTLDEIESQLTGEE